MKEPKCAWCGQPFTPRPHNAAKQRFCRVNCKTMAWRMHRYHTDPDFAARERKRERDYYHGDGYTAKRLRELRRARQRVLGQLMEVGQLVDQP